MGTVDQKLNDYIWDNLSELEPIFSEKSYKFLLGYKENGNEEGFSDTLELILDVNNEIVVKILSKIENQSKNINNMSIDEIVKELNPIPNYNFNDKKVYIERALYLKNSYTKTDEVYAKLLNNLAVFYYFNRTYDKAESFYLEALEVIEKVWGKKHIVTSKAYSNMALFYKAIGMYKEAETLHLKALKMIENLRGEKNSDIISIYSNVDIFMQDLNKLFFLNSRNSNLTFKINKIEIKNFKQFKYLFSMEFSEQINIIIGQNAIGKTTLLQAIALGLLKQDSLDAKKVEYDSYISKGQDKSELTIYHNNEEKKVKILKDKREINENYFIPFILAYGSNFFTSKTNEVKEVAQSIVNETIHKDFTTSIFVDYTNGFVNPIRLLEFLDLEKDEKVPQIQDTLISKINEFLEGFELITNDKNYYFQKDGEETRLKLEDLSEGYRGNVLLITDMLIKILGVGWTPETIEGIVLIDEFDKHLHPKWQSKLVNQLTETFPKIQFIMTSHNPMSILGRKSNQITILKEVDGKIIAEKKQGTENIDVAGVLLEYFGVGTVIGDSLEADLTNFTNLNIRDDLTTEESQELEELREKLSKTVAVNFINDYRYFEYLKRKENKTPKTEDVYSALDDLGDIL